MDGEQRARPTQAMPFRLTPARAPDSQGCTSDIVGISSRDLCDSCLATSVHIQLDEWPGGLRDRWTGWLLDP